MTHYIHCVCVFVCKCIFRHNHLRAQLLLSSGLFCFVHVCSLPIERKKAKDLESHLILLPKLIDLSIRVDGSIVFVEEVPLFSNDARLHSVISFFVCLLYFSLNFLPLSFSLLIVCRHLAGHLKKAPVLLPLWFASLGVMIDDEVNS